MITSTTPSKRESFMGKVSEYFPGWDDEIKKCIGQVESGEYGSIENVSEYFTIIEHSKGFIRAFLNHPKKGTYATGWRFR